MAQVLTGALAIIRVNGVAIGKMKNVRVSETINRGRVSGIGELTPQELPAQQWNGTLNCSFYSIEFKKDGIAGFDALPFDVGVTRTAASVAAWVEHVILQEQGVNVDIYKKVKDAVSTEGLHVNNTPQPFARIEGLHLDRDSFDITENGISGRDQDFTFTNPIVFAP